MKDPSHLFFLLDPDKKLMTFLFGLFGLFSEKIVAKERGAFGLPPTAVTVSSVGLMTYQIPMGSTQGKVCF